MQISQILTISQVAALLNVKPSWIYQRTCDGALRGTGRGRRRARKGIAARQNPCDVLERMPHFKAGRLLRFDREEVLRWFERMHRIPSVALTDDSQQIAENERDAVSTLTRS